jgi:hypothetical protein
MNKLTFVQNQTIELQHLVETAGNDPILAPQLRERLEDAQKELEEARRQDGSLLPRENIVFPKAAIFLKGSSVEGSEGIRPSLAAEALIQYEKMYTEQAVHDEREAAKKAGRQRRPRGAPIPRLMFTGTPRGSFGLEFVAITAEDGSQQEVHSQSLRNVATALVHVADSDSSTLDETIKQIPPRVVQPLKNFMKALAENNAEIRLAFPDQASQSLSVEKVRAAADRLEKGVVQTTETLTGTFRGATLESGKFDLKTDAGDVITGTVADDLSEEDLIRISSLTNHRCVATLEKTTVIKIAGAPTVTYVLIDAQSMPDPTPRSDAGGETRNPSLSDE